MPKNKVQFQKGQSLPEFLALYGTVVQCEQAVFEARWPKGFRCPSCGYHKHCQLRQRKVFQCIRCKQQVSLTAGTLFDNTKLPLTTWFLAINLLSQSKNGISAMDLKRQLGVSYNTAWMLKHKLMQTMRERDDSQPLRGIVEIDDAYLGGETSGGQRGRGAERKTPFVAAAQVSADGRPERLRLSPVAGFRKRALQALDKAVGLRPIDLGGPVLDLLELKEELVRVAIRPAAELAAVVAQYRGDPGTVLLEGRQDV